MELSKKFEDWDPMKGRIYTRSDDIKAGAFVTASTVALLATPDPTYNADSLANAILIGLIQDWNISQTKQSPQLFECGSNGKYTLSTGRVAGSCSMSRVLYSGSNLLFLLYAGQTEYKQIKYKAENLRDVAGYYSEKDGQPDRGFAINLASSLFLNPLGVIFVLRTASAIPADSPLKKSVTAFYLEEAFINSHGIGASAGAPYIGEQVTLTFEGVYPIAASLGDKEWPSRGT